MEKWKHIKGYENLYLVSNYGNVMSLGKGKSNRSQKRLLKQGVISLFYKRVALTKNSKSKFFLVHRLVAQAFLENPKNKPCVNHLDENPSNNNLSNLQWCTYKENNNHGNHNLKISLTNGKPVKQVDIKTNKTIKVFHSLNEAARSSSSFFSSSISKCCNGTQKKHAGYYWFWN